MDRSEEIGFAGNKRHAVLEYWSVGMLGLEEEDLFLYFAVLAEIEKLNLDGI